MSSSKTKSSQANKRGGLPDDSALDAFSIDSKAAQAAFAPRARRSTPAAGSDGTGPGENGGAEAISSPMPTAPVPALEAEAAPPSAVVPVRAVTPDVRPAATAAVEIPVASTISAGTDLTQCTVMVERQVRKRFELYQTNLRAQTGWEPTNAVVVRRAFLHAMKNDLWGELRERTRHRQQPVSEEDYDPDGLFGDVPARRVDRGAVKDSTQQSFRPSRQELAVYDGYAAAHGFDNRSDFLDAVLDGFLPALPTAARRATTR
ncbi:hypothetical protein [Streptomyces mirabilis]|uniref:hypothetical protein n=1 Tax=Streptomyces mirabilis TaxID=68239 RepID=UPI0036B52468